MHKEDQTYDGEKVNDGERLEWCFWRLQSLIKIGGSTDRYGAMLGHRNPSEKNFRRFSRLNGSQ